MARGKTCRPGAVSDQMFPDRWDAVAFCNGEVVQLSLRLHHSEKTALKTARRKIKTDSRTKDFLER